jgi:hypothetical protein
MTIFQSLANSTGRIRKWIGRQSLIEVLARIGYGARGLVYILVGGLAVLAALGPGGDTTGSRGALRVVLEQPLGWAWLGFIGAGLAFFVLWRLAQAVLDADRLGTSWKMLARRGGYLIGAVSYAGLAVFAVSLALGLARRSEGGAAKDWAAWLMKQPFGLWLVMAAGAGVVGAGLSFVWQAWTGERVVRFLECPPATCRWAVPLGRFGFAAIGLVLALIGGFLIVAGYYGRSGEARGVEGTLDSIAAQPFGWALLGVTALGFLAFGIFGCVQARYRRIEPPRQK